MIGAYGSPNYGGPVFGLSPYAAKPKSAQPAGASLSSIVDWFRDRFSTGFHWAFWLGILAVGYLAWSQDDKKIKHGKKVRELEEYLRGEDEDEWDYATRMRKLGERNTRTKVYGESEARRLGIIKNGRRRRRNRRHRR